MAVVQISRIQVRRGKANSGTGIPQLASGELAWAVDTQELYIGSGSVSEGAPAVENVKVITELDLSVNNNILNLLQYIYKINEQGIQTGDSPNNPVTRSIQQRLDDQITTADFGALGDGVTDDTAALQRAIDQMFLNTTRTKASVDTVDGIKNRLTLNIPAGKYIVSSTLFIPSYASLIGDGKDKTIIQYTGTGHAIRFVNDNSTPGVPSPLGNTNSNQNPRHIVIKGLTIQTTTDTQSGLQLDAVSDSVFESIAISGTLATVASTANTGIVLNAKSSLITCENNIFKDISIDNFSYAVYSDSDIQHNTFRDAVISYCHNGYILGQTVFAGQLYGPKNTVITNNVFDRINVYAVYLGSADNSTPMGNQIIDCKLTRVGNDSANVLLPLYPQIYIDSVGNSVTNIQSDRSAVLSDSSHIDVKYMPEVAGHIVYKSPTSTEIGLVTPNGYGTAFRLPISTDDQGIPSREISYVIEYVYKATSNGFSHSRRGTLKIIADLASSIANNTPYVQLTDDYEFIGDEAYATDLDFKVALVNFDGTTFVDSSGYPVNLEIKYTTTVNGTFVYSYVATS